MQAAAAASYGSQEPVEFVSAPLSYFAWELLEAKGRRKNVDAGDPHDFTRPLVKGLAGGGSVGSWACTEGGWDSPSPRTSTEFFYVLSGNGCVRVACRLSPPLTSHLHQSHRHHVQDQSTARACPSSTRRRCRLVDVQYGA
jgi:uncharacterized cupin superfamily protein